MFKGEISFTYIISLFLCSTDVTMEQWLLGDLCSPLNTEPPKLHYTYSSKPPVAMFSLTSLCCGSCDPGHDDDVIVLDDDDMRGHKEGQRFMELVVMVTKYNTITCLKRYPIITDVRLT